jgi:membrane-associated protease RseP (regulator of RpoE activity)
MEYVLLALVAGVVAPGLALLVAGALGYFTARWLGIPEFRPFRRGVPNTRWRRFFVRAASVVAAFAVCLVLGALSARASGVSLPSMFVDVYPGPARDAGIRSGDRIVSIDGKPYDDFEAMRADIQSSRGPRSITFERNGERITREVDPMPERRIGVGSRPALRPPTFAETIEQGFAACFSPFRQLRSTRLKTLAGPFALSRSIDGTVVSRGELYLYASALYAAYVWPALLLLHLIDALALHFRRDGA